MNKQDPVERMNTLLYQLDNAVEQLSPGSHNLRNSNSNNTISPRNNTLLSSPILARQFSSPSSNIIPPKLPSYNSPPDLDVRLYESIPRSSEISSYRSPHMNTLRGNTSLSDNQAQINSVMESAIRIAESAALVVEANVRETTALLQSTSRRASSSVRSTHHTSSSTQTQTKPHISSHSSTTHKHQETTHRSHSKESSKPSSKDHKHTHTTSTTTKRSLTPQKHHSSSHKSPSKEDIAEKESKAAIVLAQKISKYEAKTINRAIHAALHWSFYRLVNQIPPRLDQLMKIHLPSQTIEIATYTLMRWIHLTWSIHRTSIKPIWVQNEQLLKAKRMSLADRLSQGLPATTTGSRNQSRRPSDASISSRRSSIDYNYKSITTSRHPPIPTANDTDKNDFWVSESGYQKALALGKEENLGIPLPRPTRYFHTTIPNMEKGALRLIFQAWKNWHHRFRRIRQRSLYKRQHYFFSQWRFYLLKQQTLKAKAEIITSLQARTRAVQALNQWKYAQKLAIQYRIQMNLQKGLKHLVTLQTQRLLRNIISRWKQWSWQMQQVKLMSERNQQKYVHKKIQKWYTSTKLSIQHKILVKNNLDRLRKARLTKLFTAWKNYSHRKTLLHRLVRENQARFTQMKLHYYIRSRWKQNAQHSKHVKVIMAKAISLWKNDLLGTLFLQWKRKAHGRRARLHAAEIVAQNYRQRRLHKAVASWKQYANFSHHCKKILVSWYQTTSERKLSQMFMNWRTWAQQRRARHEKFHSLADNFRTLQVRKSIVHWKKLLTHRKASNELRVRMNTYYKQIAVRKWYMVRLQSIKYQNEDTQMLQARLRRALQVWKVFAHTSQHNKHIMLNAIRRFQHSRALAMINHWQRWTEARLLHRASVAHRDNSLLRNTFLRWKRYIENCRIVRARGYAAAAKMEQFCLRLAVLRWQQTVQDERNRRLILRRCLGVWRNRITAASFSMWSTYAKSRREWRNKREELNRIYHHQKIVKFLQHWKQRANEWKQTSLQNEKARQHSIHCRLQKSFQLLKNYGQKHRQWRSQRDDILQSYHHKKLISQIQQWHEYSRRRIHHRAIIKQLQEKRNIRTSTKVIANWTKYIQDNKVRHERAEHALITMDTYRNIHIIRNWHRTTKQHIRQETKIQEMSLRRLQKIFTYWKNKAYRTHQMKEASKKFQDLRIRYYIQRWLTRKNELQLMRKVYTTSTDHYNSTILSTVFKAWKRHTDNHARCRYLKQKITPQVTKLVRLNYQRQLFIRYRIFVEEERKRAMANDAYLKSLRRKAFSEWLRRIREKQQFRALSLAANEKLEKLRYHQQLHHWLHWAQFHRKFRLLHDKAEARSLAEWKQLTFRRWAYYVLRNRHIKTLVNDLKAQKLVYYTIATVQLWREFTVRRVYARNIITRATEGILNRRIIIALNKWRKITLDNIAIQREKVNLAHERARKRKLALVFRHFRLYIMIQKASRLALKDVLLRLSVKQWKNNTLMITDQVNGLERCFHVREKLQKQYAIQQWYSYLQFMHEERAIALRISRATAIIQKFRTVTLLRRWKRNVQHVRRPDTIVSQPTQSSDEKPIVPLRQHRTISNQLSQLGVL